MPLYFISQNIIDRHPYNIVDLLNNTIELYDKNSMTFSEWKILNQSQNRYGYVVEREECPNYWSRVIEEEPDNANTSL